VRRGGGGGELGNPRSEEEASQLAVVWFLIKPTHNVVAPSRPALGNQRRFIDKTQERHSYSLSCVFLIANELLLLLLLDTAPGSP
jgi:hypothetical protein